MPTHVVIPRQDLANVAAGVFVKLLVVPEDDDGHVDGAEDRQFVGLLEETAFAFEKGAGHVLARSSRAGADAIRTPSDFDHP